MLREENDFEIVRGPTKSPIATHGSGTAAMETCKRNDYNQRLETLFRTVLSSIHRTFF